MSDYRVIYTDLKTGTRQGEFDFSDLSYTHELNEAGSCSITVPLNGSYTNLGPGESCIYVLRDNVVVWAGIVWSVSADVEANALTLGARGWFSYFEKLLITQSVKYGTAASPVDMTSVIFKGLLDTALAKPGVSIEIDTSTITASGKLRRRTYYGHEFKSVDEAIRDLANLKQGFDFRFASRVDSGDFVTEVFTRYPNSGRTTNHIFELGGAVVLTTYTADAESMANTIYVQSASYGNNGGTIKVVDNANLDEYPVFERALVHNDIGSRSNLEDKGELAIRRGKKPAESISIQTTAETVPRLGSYEVGDRVRVRGTYGWLDIDRTYRITSYTVNVGGSEIVDISLAPLNLFI